jgi:type IX secretion system PorP/SprF family membrane protein
MKRIIILVIINALTLLTAKAQFDSQLTNYWAIPGYFNPASIGLSKKLEATAITRMQWVGITNAPKTTIVTANMPYELLGHTHGLGGKMYNDRAGLFSVSMFAGQYDWQKNLLKGTLSIGLEIGYINQSFDGAKVEIPEDDYHEQQDDAIPTSLVTGKSVDASAGVFFKRKKWHAGLSVAHILAPKIELGEKNIYEIPRTYYFVGGYNIPLSNPLLEVRPMLLVKTMEMRSVYIDKDSIDRVEGKTFKAMLRNSQIDASVRLYYNERFWCGLTWRNGDAVGVMIGLQIKMIEIGYAYDFPISVVRSQTTGSHELFLKYSMDINLKKKTKDKHKSVRFL